MTPLETLALVALVAAVVAVIVATTRRGADTPPAEDMDDWSRSEPDETDTARRPGRAGLLVLAALVLALPGCASMGGPRHVGTVGLVSAHSVLSAVQDTEMRLVCGRAGAPQAPLCVPISKHQVISAHLAEAYALEIRAASVMRALPVGSPQPAEVVSLAFQVNALVQQVLAMLPDGKDKSALVQSIGGTR